jgi:hypothetical protein
MFPDKRVSEETLPVALNHRLMSQLDLRLVNSPLVLFW